MTRRWNLRSLFERRFDRGIREGDESPRRVVHGAGRAISSGNGSAFEMLERRILLAGDHPSLVDFPDATDLDPNFDGNGRTFAEGTISVLGDGSLDPGDLFKFTAPSNDFVRVLADAQNIETSDLDTKITVFREENGGLTPLGTSSDNGALTAGTPTDAGFEFVAEEDVQYFIHVFSEVQDVDDPTATGDYKIRVRTQSTQLVYDPNTDTIGLPPIDPMDGPAPIEGELGTDDPTTPGVDPFSQDDKVFRFTTPDLEEFDSLMGAVGRPLNGAAELDTRLEIFDAEGNLVASDSQSSFETAAFTTLRSAPGTEFFFRVRSDEFQDPGTVPASGEFGLKVIGSANDVPIDPVRREAIDAGALLFSEDFDLRRFTSITEGLSFITSVPLSAPFDVRLTLFDVDGNQIEFSDDFVGQNAEIQTELPGGEDFFVLIDSVDDAQVTPPAFGGDQFQLVIEAAHPFDDPDDGDPPVDDQVDTPPDTLPEAERRERFEEATPLVFEDPVPFFDADGNLVRDAAFTATATATGRTFEAGDTDLFQFVPPVDLLSDFEGNNDDVGTSLFAGGTFAQAEASSAFPVNSDGLALWDAGDFFPVGDQRIIEDPAGNPVQLGFVDNPATSDTNAPQIRALQEVTINGAPALIVGGDFQLNVPTGDPFNPFVTHTNLAVWAFNPAPPVNPNSPRYFWSSIGDVDGPVLALNIFDPEPIDGGADPAGPQLVVGGQFTNAGGENVTNLAAFDLASQAWQGVVGAPQVPGNGVFALEVFDPRDPGAGREAALNGLEEPINIDVGDGPISIARKPADIEGDNIFFATANSDDDTVSVIRGSVDPMDGDLEFFDAESIPVGAGPTDVTIDDINDDNFSDLIVTNGDGNSVTILLGFEDGFQSPTTINGVGDRPNTVITGDFDGDNNVDFIIANRFDGDVKFFAGDGSGNFAGAVTIGDASGGTPTHLAAADVDGDGDLDLGVTDIGADAVRVLLNDGGASFTLNQTVAVDEDPAELAFGDMDGDGSLDVVTANRIGDNVSVALGNNDGTFQGAVESVVEDAPTSLALEDFDGDGILDVFTTNPGNSSITIGFGAGDGTLVNAFTFVVEGDAPTGPQDLVVGDFDEDGNIDVATANEGTDQVAVLRGNGEPLLDAVPDIEDPVSQLVIGGDFQIGNPNNDMADDIDNLAFWDGQSDLTPAAIGFFRVGDPDEIPQGTDGPVHALTVFNPPEDPDDSETDFGPRLIIGGDFTMAGGVAANNIASFGEIDTSATGTDEDSPNFAPQLLYDSLGSGVTTGVGTDAVFALDVWTPPEIDGFDVPGDLLGLTPDLDEPEILVIGGQFDLAGGGIVANAALWDGAPGGGVFAPMVNPGPSAGAQLPDGTPVGFDAPVRALEVMVDAQEPQIGEFENPDIDTSRQVIFAGGAFTGGTSMFDVEVVQPFPPFFQFEGQGTEGFDDTVFALAEFDDQNPAFDNSGLLFDRHDRASARPQLVVSPGAGSFVNTQIRIFDSNLTEVYSVANGDPGADTIAPPFPDPSGMLDPARPGVNPETFNDDFRGIDLFAGEVYYIEVSTLSNTGLFNLSLSVNAPGLAGPDLGPPDLDADGLVTDLTVDPSEPDYGTVAPFTSDVLGRTMPAELDGDGVFFGPNDTRIEVQDPQRFQFPGAPAFTLTASGDATNDRTQAPAGTFDLNQLGLQGHQQRITRVSPSEGVSIAEEGDLGLIHSINDVDVFEFVAPKTGTVELRVATAGLSDLFNGFNRSVGKTFDSPLDASLRIFNNDFEQIGFNDDSNTVPGRERTLPFTGTFPFANSFDQLTFNERDPRLVVPVEEGVTYFVVVESGQRFVDGAPDLPEDRTLRERPDIDWRRATGSYALLVNAPNGPTVLDPGDDHIDNTLGQGTVIPLADDGTSQTDLFVDDNGTPQAPGDDFFFDGRINDSDDTDSFELIAPASGTMTVRLERAVDSSQLLPRIDVFEIEGQNTNLLGTDTSNAQGVAEVTVPVERGQIYVLRAGASGGTTGQYRISVEAPAFIDDFANEHKIAEATEVELLDHLGLGEISGSIEGAGDSDLFRFVPTGTQEITVSVESANNVLNARVTVFEVTEDFAGPAANPVLARIGESVVEPDGQRGAHTVVSVNTNRVSSNTGSEFPYYFILVEGVSPEFDTGNYTLRLETAATDDHPDLEDLATRPGNASEIVIEQSTGEGDLLGDIEQASDSDLFTFIAPAGGPMNINAFSTSSLDSVIEVFDSDQNSIAMSDTDVNITVVRNARYFVVVSPNPDASAENQSGTYQLRIQGPANDDNPNATEFDIATVVPLDPETGDGSVGTGTPGGNNPRLAPSTDSDLFRFTTLGDASADEPLLVSVAALPEGAALTIEPRVTIFDAQENVVVDEVNPNPGETLTIDLGTDVPAGTTFFVLVQDRFTAPQNNNEYTLTIDGAPGDPPQDDDPGGLNFSDPRVITLNSLGDRDTTDQIEVEDDRDLFRFTAPADGETFVQVVTPSGSVLDAAITILDAPSEDPGNVVATDSGGIPGVSASTSFSVQGGQDIYVIVDGVGPGTGSYTLRVDAVGAPVATQIPEVDQLGFNHRLFFPEGFASAQTSEFVSIANPNDFDVRYSLILRFEEGERDAVVVNDKLIEAGSRGGETLSRVGDFAEGVRPNTPFAIEIVSSGLLGATLSRFDFDTSMGEAFTTQINEEWTFGRVERVPGVRDFVVLFNPSDFAIDVTLSATLPDGSVAETTKRVEGLRRSGFDISKLSDFPSGIFGATLTAEPVDPADEPAFDGVVASISHFDVQTKQGFGLLGDPQGGNLAGSINSITQGEESDAEIVLFNPSDSPATVSLTGKFVRADLPDFSNNIQVPANGVVTLDGGDLGLIENQPAGLFYTSDLPVSAVFSEQRPSDSNGQAASSLVGTNFFFGDAFIRRSRAGELYFETLSFFNPSASPIDIEVEFLYVNGNSETFLFNVDAQDFGEFVIHESEQFLEPTTPDGQEKTAAFSIQATSSDPFSISLNHFDLFFGSGWGTGGANLGLVNPVSRIL